MSSATKGKTPALVEPYRDGVRGTGGVTPPSSEPTTRAEPGHDPTQSRSACLTDYIRKSVDTNADASILIVALYMGNEDMLPPFVFQGLEDKLRVMNRTTTSGSRTQPESSEAVTPQSAQAISIPLRRLMKPTPGTDVEKGQHEEGIQTVQETSRFLVKLSEEQTKCLWLQDIAPPGTASKSLIFRIPFVAENERLKGIMGDIRDVLSRELESRPERSIIFVSHGFAGLLVPKVLDFSEDRLGSPRNTIPSSTKAILTFATPFKVEQQSMRLTQVQDWALEAGAPPNFLSSDVWRGTYTTDLGAFCDEKDILVHDLWKRPFSLNDEYSLCLNIRKIASFSGTTDPDFDFLFQSIMQANSTHRFFKAVAAGDNAAVEKLIRCGVSLRVMNRNQQTALHIAAQHKIGNIVRILLQSKERNYLLTQRDKDGNTALHTAVQATHDDEGPSLEIVRLLYQHGANPKTKNKMAKSPMELAKDEAIGSIFKTTRPCLHRSSSSAGFDNQSSCPIEKGKPPSPYGIDVCRGIEATITTFLRRDNPSEIGCRSDEISIYDLIYGGKSMDEILKDLGHEPNGPWSSIVCRWIHIPLNIIAWVNDLLAVLGNGTWPQELIEASLKFQGRGILPQSKQFDIHTSFGSVAVRSLVMPYISYQDYLTQLDYDACLDALEDDDECMHTLGFDFFFRGSRNRARIWPNRPERLFDLRESSNLDPTQIKALRAYLGHQLDKKQLSLIPRRTLDQWYHYPGQNLPLQDQSQVVTRWNHGSKRSLKGNKSLAEKMAHNILMVDQLWLWRISPNEQNPGQIITCFPSREGSVATNFDDIRQKVFLDMTGLSTDDIESKIIHGCADLLNQDDEPSLRFLPSFETAIEHAKNEVPKLSSDFRHHNKLLGHLNEVHPAYQWQKLECLKALVDTTNESEWLDEMKDVQDEINIILSVLEVQRTVLDQAELSRDTLGTGKEVMQKLICLKDHANAIEQEISGFVETKQKRANLWEARSSREGAEAAADQGRTIMAFTIVTIIFLPLSFMSSFFAISVQEFPRSSDGNNVAWPLGKLCGILFGVSVAIIIPSLTMAFKVSTLIPPWIYLRYIWPATLMLPLLELFRVSLNKLEGSLPLSSFTLYLLRAWGEDMERNVIDLLIERRVSLYISKERQRSLNEMISLRWNTKGDRKQFSDLQADFQLPLIFRDDTRLDPEYNVRYLTDEWELFVIARRLKAP